mmetsp:Transcript_6655/g.24874  ORF Transcript_6655/g.24874 Transcript_6655/m.24874 type:complete len:237 (-) Transcript_6655:2022-2732(-)
MHHQLEGLAANGREPADRGAHIPEGLRSRGRLKSGCRGRPQARGDRPRVAGSVRGLGEGCFLAADHGRCQRCQDGHPRHDAEVHNTGHRFAGSEVLPVRQAVQRPRYGPTAADARARAGPDHYHVEPSGLICHELRHLGSAGFGGGPRPVGSTISGPGRALRPNQGRLHRRGRGRRDTQDLEAAGDKQRGRPVRADAAGGGGLAGAGMDLKIVPHDPQPGLPQHREVGDSHGLRGG